MGGLIVDLFAGPGGWSEGLRILGVEAEIGVELDRWACETRAAAGHVTVRADVATWPLEKLAGKVDGLIASPPCPDFSAAGKGAGIDGASGRLLPVPLRWAEELRPRWVAFEQVPPVLPYWRLYAATLRGLGYSTWEGLLCAADYGVPQTRVRAILIASLDRKVGQPRATHAEDPEHNLLGEGLPVWVSMGEALGLDPCAALVAPQGPGSTWKPKRREASRPAQTIAFGKDPGGWRFVVDTNSSDVVDRGLEEPAATVTSKVRNWRLKPSPTLTTTRRTEEGLLAGRSRAEGEPITIEQAGVLQGFRPDYPWRGPKWRRAQQVGNAVPPPLAAAILREVL